MEEASRPVTRDNGFANISSSYKIRISEPAFIGSTVTFLSIAIFLAFMRTVLRWRHYGRLVLDDYVLMFACACLIATAGVAWTIKDLVYLQIYVGLGWQQPADDFFPRMLVFEQRVVVCSGLVWAAIYSVKFSFLLFFRRLVDRIRSLMVQWWVVLAFLVAGACVSVPLAVIICPHYGEDYMSYCSIPSQIAHETVYLNVSVAIDVFTDALLVSIPLTMLWGLQMPLRRKLGLALLLSLSVFMIAIAIIRTTLAPLPNGVIDTSWLVFWQGMEAVVAVLMVSLTAIRGLFSQERERSSAAKRNKSYRQHQRLPDADGAAAPGRADGSSDQSSAPHSSSKGGSSGSRNNNKKRNKGLYHEDSILMTTASSSTAERCRDIHIDAEEARD